MAETKKYETREGNMGTSTSKNRIVHEVQENVHISEAGGPLEFFAGCPKNVADPSHHKRFKAFDEFLPEDIGPLPKEFEPARQNYFDYIKTLMFFVVRMHVGFISDERPDDYLFSKYRGTSVNTCGTGYVGYIYDESQMTSEDQLKLLQSHKSKCKTCQQGGDKSQVWVLPVKTARHVTFDESEASHSKVVFFDHNNNGEGSVVESQLQFGWGDTSSDYSLLYLFTHNRDLVNKLRSYETQCDEIVKTIEQKVPKSCKTNRVALISHPHGRKMYVTLGDWISGAWYEEGQHSSQSCSGSSGGVCLRFDKLSSGLFYRQSHCGVYEDTGLGYSTPYWYF